MNRNLIGLIISYTGMLAVLLLAQPMERFGKEASRKFVHIATCNWWIVGMLFFDSLFWAAAVPASFVMANLFSYRFSLFKSIERNEGKGDPATVYYAVALFVLAALCLCRDSRSAAIGGTGVFALGYGDGFAALAGKRIRSPGYTVLGAKKTVAGNLAVLLCSFAAVFVLLTALRMPHAATVALAVAATAAAMEIVTPFGLDNLTVPFASAGMAALLL